MNQSPAFRYPARLFCKILKQKLAEVGIKSDESITLDCVYVYPNKNAHKNLYGIEVTVSYVVIPIFHRDFINVVINRLGFNSSSDCKINGKLGVELINNIVEHFKIKASE